MLLPSPRHLNRFKGTLRKEKGQQKKMDATVRLNASTCGQRGHFAINFPKKMLIVRKISPKMKKKYRLLKKSLLKNRMKSLWKMTIMAL